LAGLIGGDDPIKRQRWEFVEALKPRHAVGYRLQDGVGFDKITGLNGEQDNRVAEQQDERHDKQRDRRHRAKLWRQPDPVADPHPAKSVVESTRGVVQKDGDGEGSDKSGNEIADDRGDADPEGGDHSAFLVHMDQLSVILHKTCHHDRSGAQPDDSERTPRCRPMAVADAARIIR
jgi:hypothetical protein